MNVSVSCSCCQGKEGEILYDGLTSIYSSDKWSLARCLTCGNIITLPVPDAQLLGRIYSQTYLYPVHRAAMGEKRFRSKSMAGFIRTFRPPSSGTTILEAGCMYGYLLEELKDDYSVKGIEIGSEAVDFCRRHGLDVTDIPLEEFLKQDSSFDVIILSHVFEHLLLADEVFEKLLTKLGDDGVLVISVPNSDSFCRKLFGRYWGWWQVPVHINHFSESALRRLVQRFDVSLATTRKRGGDSLMLMLNFINLLGFRGAGRKPGPLQVMLIVLWSALTRWWYYLGNEELTVVIRKTKK